MVLEEGFPWLTADCGEGARVPFHNVECRKFSCSCGYNEQK